MPRVLLLLGFWSMRRILTISMTETEVRNIVPLVVPLEQNIAPLEQNIVQRWKTLDPRRTKSFYYYIHLNS